MLIKRSLDADGCIDLLAVMRIMNQISQEQAWALAYELAALMQRLWPAGNNCVLIENLAQIHINQEGWIHPKSLLSSTSVNASLPVEVDGNADVDQKQPEVIVENEQQTEPKEQQLISSSKSTSEQLPPTPPITPELESQLSAKTKQQQSSELTTKNNEITNTNDNDHQIKLNASNEIELVGSLGITLFWALDFGLAEDEERKLSAAMEYLIMQSQNPDGHLTLGKVQEICIKRLPVATKLDADKHYRTLCKSLISDTLELSKLLDKIDNSLVIYAEAAAHLHHHHHHHHNHHHQHHHLNNNHNTFTSTNHHHHHHHQLIAHHLDLVDQDDLSELGLPLACLKALKINDWARLWMQVNRELRQRRKFTQIHHQMHEHEFTTTTTTSGKSTTTSSE